MVTTYQAGKLVMLRNDAGVLNTHFRNLNKPMGLARTGGKLAIGVWVLNIETGETLGFCRFEDGVQEIFAVEVMAGMPFPDLVNHDPKIVGSSYVLSNEALKSVPESLKK